MGQSSPGYLSIYLYLLARSIGTLCQGEHYARESTCFGSMNFLSFYDFLNDRNAIFTSEKPKKYHAWSCQKLCDALAFLLDNIFIRFGTKLYRQVVGVVPMGTNCAPLVADLFLFCYERDFMVSLSDDKQSSSSSDKVRMLLMRLTLHPDIWTIF